MTPIALNGEAHVIAPMSERKAQLLDAGTLRGHRPDVVAPGTAPRPPAGWGDPGHGGGPPVAAARVRLHPVTLRFDGPIEAEFEEEFFRRTLPQLRLALALGIVLYAAFGLLDELIAPDDRRTLWMIRYAAVCPLFSACLALTYSPSFRRFREVAVSITVLLGSFGIIAMTAIIPAPGSYLYYAGLLLVMMYAFTLVRLSLVSATTISVLTVVAYLGVALWINETPGRLVTNNLFFLVAAFLIGVLSHYSMERYARNNFLQRRVIALRTQELEHANAELRSKHRELLESRSRSARTARQSELIFSALSDALPGTVLDGKYRVGERIGAGSVGTVYRGEHVLLHHPVAIKVFRPAIGQAALDSLDRFRLEGISACRVNHRNAVSVLDFEVSSGGLAYLVMELLEGQSLADALRERGRFEPDECVRIARAVCDVLAEAHAAGIVHRDIKPGNIFLHRRRGELLVKVIDFGIAKLTDESVTAGLENTTSSGILVGTPAYVAPERVLGEAYDGRADVYAVGVVMYEMLTGRLPFSRADSRTHPATWSSEQLPLRVGSLAPGTSPHLERVVTRAMAVDAEQRPTAAELAHALRQLPARGDHAR